jgi:SWI/SNF related-matrix-associated actin-dependent regulator of chromatin subfamily C
MLLTCGPTHTRTQVEKTECPEFFSGKSGKDPKTPQMYKEYRNMLIAKFRENPARQLTFHAVRSTMPTADMPLLSKVRLRNW